MTRLGWFECRVLGAFFYAAMAAALIGGMKWVGWVAEVFLWTTFFWLARVAYIEFRDELMEEYEKAKVFKQWRKLQSNRLKGME